MKKKILLLVGTALLFFAVTSMAQVKNAKQKIISNIDREQFIETYSHTGGVMVDGMSVYIEKNKLNISLSSGNNQKLIYKEISIKETIKNEKYIVTAICNKSTVPFTFYKRKGIYYYFVSFKLNNIDWYYEVRKHSIEDFVTLISATNVNNIQKIIFKKSNGEEAYFCNLPIEYDYFSARGDQSSVKFEYENKDGNRILKSKFLNVKYKVWYFENKFFNASNNLWEICYEIEKITKDDTPPPFTY